MDRTDDDKIPILDGSMRSYRIGLQSRLLLTVLVDKASLLSTATSRVLGPMSRCRGSRSDRIQERDA